jgi:hydrogenase/urease accessory protein HupE
VNGFRQIIPLLAIWLFAAVRVAAHDPGLSAVEVETSAGRLTAHLTFARLEIEPLVAIDADRDGRVSAMEVEAARPRLASLAREALEVRLDGRELPATTSSGDLDSSDAVHLRLAWEGIEGAQLRLRSMLIARLAPGHRQYLTLAGAGGEVISQRLLDARADAAEWDLAATSQQPFREFLLLGIEHILTGYDHLLFLLALLIAGGTLREAVKIITSFTIAHSITLALATLDLVRVPAMIVEPLIALTIVYVGLENIFRPEARRRWMLTFIFGLVHGFGFASVLRDLGVGTGRGAVGALVAFNLGVEAGQLAIAALAWPLIWHLRSSEAFVRRFVPACSLLVALLGSYWLLERTWLK